MASAARAAAKIARCDGSQPLLSRSELEYGFRGAGLRNTKKSLAALILAIACSACADSIAISLRHDAVASKDVRSPSGVAATLVTSPAPVIAYQAATFVGSASAPSDVTIEKYELDFGDGERLTRPATSKELNVLHTYARTGSYTATLTVTTTSGETAATSKSIYVTEN
jgi:hypothetical protein